MKSKIISKIKLYINITFLCTKGNKVSKKFFEFTWTCFPHISWRNPISSWLCFAFPSEGHCLPAFLLLGEWRLLTAWHLPQLLFLVKPPRVPLGDQTKEASSFKGVMHFLGHPYVFNPVNSTYPEYKVDTNFFPNLRSKSNYSLCHFVCLSVLVGS